MSDDTKTTSPEASDGGCPPGGVKDCPLECKCGTVRWIDTQAFCGDEVKLQATFTGNCPDGPATVEILNAGSAIDTISSTLTGGVVDAKWIAKAPTANWRTDRLRFRVTAAGRTCQSSNEFTFKQRPTTAWELLNVAHASGNGYAPAHEKHDARLEADKVHYLVKLKTYGAAFPATKQASSKTLIQDTWNNGFGSRRFHRTKCKRGETCDCTFDCCKCSFQLEINFVTSGAHVDVKIIPGPHSSGMNGDGAEWADPPYFTLSYPHEVGHVLGQHDEYSTGAWDPTGVQPHKPGGEANLMGDKSAPLLNRHFRYVLKFLNSKAGDTYETIPK